MLTENIKIRIGDTILEVSKNSTLLEISKMVENKLDHEIVLAKVNGSYCELYKTANDNDVIEFCDLTDPTGNKVYLSGLILLVKYAFNEVFGKKNRPIVKYSADKALCFDTTSKIKKEDLEKVEVKMKELVEANLPINPVIVLKKEASEYFEKNNYKDKVGLLKYNPNSYVKLYKMGNMYDYFINYMPPSTDCLTEFDIDYLDNDTFILKYPTSFYYKKIKDYVHHDKLFNTFQMSKEWASVLQINTSSDLNDRICKGDLNSLIKMNETLANSILVEKIKTLYYERRDIKVVLMAGPSSSGKTTTCSKIAMYLTGVGITPKMISMDNFFKNRVDTPKKENGEYDFECLEALDLNLFNKTIKDLMDGKTVLMPEFNFITGEKVFKHEMTLKDTDILLIEGIHALNPKLLPNVEKNRKFKIYLSPLTPINIDSSNKASTTDNRLLRRIIRDYRTRGYGVEDTLALWRNVREGEEKYIFPFQDEADLVYNTSLIYEFSVLRTYVMPLLYSVPITSQYYGEARRLIKSLNVFIPISSEDIPDDSVLREFIGGSCF